MEKIEVTWSEVTNDVLRIANEVIASYHPDLKDAAIGFVFRSTSSKSMGRRVLGKAAKMPDKVKPFMDAQYDFIIWLAEDAYANMDEKTRKALIDHELSHCTMEDDKPKMMPHDVEEFTHIVNRYGLWQYDLISFGAAVQSASQPPIFPPEPPRGSVKAIDPDKMLEPEEREKHVGDMLDKFLQEHDEDDD